MILLTQLFLYCHIIVSCRFNNDLVTIIYQLLLLIQLTLYCNILFHPVLGRGNPSYSSKPLPSHGVPMGTNSDMPPGGTRMARLVIIPCMKAKVAS